MYVMVKLLNNRLGHRVMLKINASLCTLHDIIYYLRESEYRFKKILFTRMKEATWDVRERLEEEAAKNPDVGVSES